MTENRPFLTGTVGQKLWRRSSLLTSSSSARTRKSSLRRLLSSVVVRGPSLRYKTLPSACVSRSRFIFNAGCHVFASFHRPTIPVTLNKNTMMPAWWVGGMKATASWVHTGALCSSPTNGSPAGTRILLLLQVWPHWSQPRLPRGRNWHQEGSRNQ